MTCTVYINVLNPLTGVNHTHPIPITKCSPSRVSNRVSMGLSWMFVLKIPVKKSIYTLCTYAHFLKLVLLLQLTKGALTFVLLGNLWIFAVLGLLINIYRFYCPFFTTLVFSSPCPVVCDTVLNEGTLSLIGGVEPKKQCFKCGG